MVSTLVHHTVVKGFRYHINLKPPFFGSGWKLNLLVTEGLNNLKEASFRSNK